MKSETLAALIDHICASHRIALILHVSPDGDTCGSAFALRRALLSLGKEVACVCDQSVPHIYDDLDGADALRTPDTLAGETFDLTIAVDVADRARMGQSVAVFDSGRATAQIDHHGTNPEYAQVNYVISPLSATAVLVAHVVDALGVPLDEPLAKCLFVGVATDTGNFKHRGTDAEALQLAARCIAAGVDSSAVTRRVFDLRPLAQNKLLARALESMQLFDNGRIAIMQLTHDDFTQTGSLPEHTEGIVNFGINTEGVVMACLMSVPVEKVRCSLRSLMPYDVSVVACALGGGGHELASGCTLEPPLDAALKQMLTEMRKELARHE